MCGIFGWQWRQQSVPTRDKRIVLATMLGDRNDNRGGKSWGWCATPTTQRPDFAISRGLDLIVSQAPAMATFSSLMGHTRQPTTGAVIKENSHPFEIGGIIGAHNGMVSNWRELEHKYQERKKFAVDSMHIFAHLDEGKNTEELQCYGAIEWIEREREPDHFLLCKLSYSGDLEIARTPHGIVWSSTKAALEAALEAAEITITTYLDVKQGHVIAVYDGEAWTTGREIKISTYYRTSYASTSGGRDQSYYGDRSYTDWWENNNPDKQGASKSDECENQMCGSPLDDSGNCTVMFDEKCTGAAANIVNHGKISPLKLVRNKLSQPPSCKEASDDPTVKAICMSVCESCKAGNERDGRCWHESLEGSMKVSRMCRGPDYAVSSLYARTIALFLLQPGTVEASLRQRFTLAHQTWGWVMYDDKKPWTLPDYYKTLKSMECKFCHNLKWEKSEKGLCEECQKKMDDKELHVCQEEGCLAVPAGDLHDFCARHKCAEDSCKKQSQQTSFYCEECRAKRHGADAGKQMDMTATIDAQAEASNAASNG